MDPTDGILSFLDVLDIDEQLIDTRLKSIIERSNYTDKHLKNALLLLQYKHLINKQEETECENDTEFNFTAKLLSHLQEENIEIVCKIINIVLCLNPTTIVSKSEHLLQQILSCIYLPNSNEVDNKTSANVLLHLKICDSILDAVLNNGQKIALYFMETPLADVLNYPNEKLKVHFLTCTIPKLFAGVIGYNILDNLWEYMKHLDDDHKENALQILCCLSQYYLPIQDDKSNIKTYSTIINENDFWRIVLFGLNSLDISVRKTAIYLAKRAIDYVAELKKDVRVKYNNLNTFAWNQRNSQILKSEWDNFFILIESLEEKQSNIVLPSVQLFEYLNNFEKCWLMCAFNIGLKHDNVQVRLKCIEYRLTLSFENVSEAAAVLEASNDIHLFDSEKERKALQAKLNQAITGKHCIVNILKAIPEVKWSPVPLYYLSEVISSLTEESIQINVNDNEICDIVKNILKTPCNNVIIRKAIHLNISHFIGKCCRNYHWKSYAHLYSLVQNDLHGENPLITLIRNINLSDIERKDFFKYFTKFPNVDFCLYYLGNHQEHVTLFIDTVNEVLNNIKSIISRQYCDKLQCLEDVLFITNLFAKTKAMDSDLAKFLNEVIMRDLKTLLQYILCLFTNDTAVSIDNMKMLFTADHFVINNANDELREILLELYKTSTPFLIHKETDLDKKLLSLFVLNNIIFNNRFEYVMHKHEKLNLETVIQWSNDLPIIQSVESTGRLKNRFHEEACKLIYTLLKQQEDFDVKHLLDYIEKLLDCGGYGCLRWILKIVNKSLGKVLSSKQFNLAQFLSRIWREIDELKSNYQYTFCIKEFVDILTNDVVLNKPEYNNTFLSYCLKIIEYAAVKKLPLSYLILKLKDKTSLEPHLVCILCEILLYSPVQRKEQRITDCVEIHIMNDVKYGLNKSNTSTNYDFQIQYTSLSTICKIKDTETLKIILDLIKTKIDCTFRNKVRYHGNSQPHRMLFTALQHFLFILLLNVETRSECLFTWCLEMLGKLPHQPSVRICLEWYITLYLYLENRTLNEDILLILKSKNVSLSSQFFIIYWLLKHKLIRKVNTTEEFDFVMDTLLSHTMGQIFNIRLQAQYLANNLSKMNSNGSLKYASIIKIIERTFSQSSKDKNFCKLQQDYFANHFDIVSNLTAYFICEMVAKYSEVSYNDEKDVGYIKNILDVINKDVEGVTNDFKKEWATLRLNDNSYSNVEVSAVVERNLEDIEAVGTIQKKYIPWKSMTDVNMYEVGKKRDSGSELVVVASLIDKLPNLGGMARTCEVFGVKKYVVDSLRHLADKQFQGLSVSAERWIDVDEVRPGAKLKDYLNQMKAEGFSVVAAEQTSTSCKLQDFKFPKKTLLLLGHEKEGVSCDLLPMMDYCVEIPQQGFVRSLNVHVTAAIFVWEYTRQNIL